MAWGSVWRSRIFTGASISFPNGAQTFESEEIVDILDEFRSGPDHRTKATGRDHVRLLAQLREQQFQNAIDESEISVVEARLQTAHGIRSDHAGRLANLNAGKPCSAFEKSIGRNADAGADHAAEIFAFAETQSKVVAVPKSTITQGPPYFSKAATALTIRSAPTSAGLS